MEVTKVLVINTVGFKMGGISAVIMNYYEHMDFTKIHMDFVANHVAEPCFKHTVKSHHSKIYILERNKNTWKYMINLYHILKEHHYDVIHVHGNSATMAVDLLPALCSGCKIRIAHSHNTQCKHTVIHKMLNPVLKHCYTRAIACSKEAGSWIFGKNKFDILPNGIDIEKYKFSENTRTKIRQELKINEKIVIGHVGFMTEQKNHEKLLEIVYEMKKIDNRIHLLCITGNDTIPQDIKVKIHDYGLEKNITILKKRNDVNLLLQAMDLFVFPSRFEGLPLTLIEAQASGLKCLASNQITKEVNISKKIRFLSLLEDSRVWAEKGIKMIGNEDRENTEEYKAIYHSVYNIENDIQLLMNIYKNL